MAVHIFSHRRILFTYSNIYACDRLYFKETKRNIVDEAGMVNICKERFSMNSLFASNIIP